MYSSVVLGKLLLQYTFYTSSRGKMPCNDGKEKGEFLLSSKLMSKCDMQQKVVTPGGRIVSCE